ncbi:tryptophan--tRNA ligase [Candidatus Saccharibacteria bacterium RIFCSPHIGHO2_12_FULL_41_12]|nr:MAG: tryptophan--tRNA ligase [Candidatus Saccharibacteria bacterium RIFCSPHIGHO2_12_FULL_41_12]
MSKPVILTGLRANNDLHIGNYLGALLPIVDLARNKSDEYQVNLFVPDLHSFTTPIDHSKLQEQIMQNLRVFVAAGLPLDNSNINLYRQSHIPAHSELTIILNSFTGYGEMRRMTQFKDKSSVKEISVAVGELAQRDKTIRKYLEMNSEGSKEKELIASFLFDYTALMASIAMMDRVSVGLFDYPILMASDILLYDAIYVPVGDDQTQHLEFTRDIAQRMNNKFGDIFTVPKPVADQHKFFGKDQGLRVKDLLDPTKKMSKSDESGRGIIFMSDSPEDARKKIMGATTDSLANVVYDPEKQPGVANLLQIHALLSNQPLDKTIEQFKGQTQYGEFKTAVADVVAKFLDEFQIKLRQVDDFKLLNKLQLSETAMNEVANKTLQKVQKAVGLRS